MKFSTHIRPISYLKAHTAEIIRTMAENAEPLIITQNGEAKAVLQDIGTWEQEQETMALLKILALGSKQIEEKKVQRPEDVLKRIREKKNSI